MVPYCEAAAISYIFSAAEAAVADEAETADAVVPDDGLSMAEAEAAAEAVGGGGNSRVMENGWLDAANSAAAAAAAAAEDLRCCCN